MAEMMDTSENVNVHTRKWVLQAESEYRFELDPGTSLAIKVCPSVLRILSGVPFCPYFFSFCCARTYVVY